MKSNSKITLAHVFVLGLGKSGMAAIRELTKRNIHITVNDGSSMSACTYLDELSALNVDVHFGDHPSFLLVDSVDLVIKTPGIHYTNPILTLAKERNIPIITEIELGYLFTEAKIAAITGSNGKTTTTSLVGKIMETANRTHEVCGNIGTVLLEKATLQQNEWLIAELSSFQLEGTVDFKPNIACLLNFSETHMDFHKTKENYLNAKLKVFQNQTESDHSVLNFDDTFLQALPTVIQSDIHWFSRLSKVPKGTYIHQNDILFKDDWSEFFIMHVKDIPLKGEHNVENVLAAITIAMLIGVKPSDIRSGIMKFLGVEHRLEFVGTVAGADYYNDSKSTNPTSTIKAIESFQQPVILILGGKDRGSDFTELQQALSLSTVTCVVTHGETNTALAAIAEKSGILDVQVCSTVSESVAYAQQKAECQDIVLFSPACAGWGLYKSFEERGHDFKNSIKKEANIANA